MKAIVNIGPNRLALQEAPIPEPRRGQVRIRTAACGICATDLAMIAGWERTGFPSIPGHEWAGFIDAVGEGVSADLVGRKCVGENVLSDGGEVGFEHPGGYAEYFLTEAANLHLLPDDFPVVPATLIEPLAVAIRGVRRLETPPRDPVLILGDGPLGLLVLLVVLHEGSRSVTIVGGREGRLRLARESGAAQVFDHRRLGPPLGPHLLQASRQRYRTIIEASGSLSAARAALHVAEHDARIVILGDYGDVRADFLWNDVLHKELRIIGSNTGAGAWSEAVRLAVDRKLPIERLVSHVLPAKRFGEGFRILREAEESVIKVILTWM